MGHSEAQLDPFISFINLLNGQKTNLNIKTISHRSLCGITAMKKLNLGIKKDWKWMCRCVI
ncbi:hypothetical protein YC2023_120691 [Brassica napus]